MADRAGASGAATIEAVRLEVERLDHTGSDAGALVLRASGRAWAPFPVRLGLPVLLAGAARVTAVPGAGGISASPDGPGWAADFRVPPTVADAADSWSVETGLATETPAEESAVAGRMLLHALDELREVDRTAVALEHRANELATLAGRTREADARRLATAEAARRQGERLLGAAAAERDEAVEASAVAAARLAANDAARAEWVAQRDGQRAERDQAVRGLDVALAERDQARERADEVTAELQRVEERWRAAAAEVREVRAALEVATLDRDRLEHQLAAATRERDELRGRLETGRALEQEGAHLAAPSRPLPSTAPLSGLPSALRPRPAPVDAEAPSPSELGADLDAARSRLAAQDPREPEPPRALRVLPEPGAEEPRGVPAPPSATPHRATVPASATPSRTLAPAHDIAPAPPAQVVAPAPPAQVIAPALPAHDRAPAPPAHDVASAPTPDAPPSHASTALPPQDLPEPRLSPSGTPAREAEVTATPVAAAAADPLPVSEPAAPAGGRRRRAGTLGIGVLAGAGALLVAEAAATVAWKEPVSALFAAHQQSTLTERLDTLDTRLASVAPSAAARQTAAARMAQLAQALRATARPGEPVGRLSIPRVEHSWVVVQGTGTGQLRKGPGHYSTTSLPGRPGTTAIAAHRTTFGAPFRHLDQLRTNDRLVMRMPYGTFTYRVERTRIVKPGDTSALRDAGRPRLVLTADNPRWASNQRLVVVATQVSAAPRGAATRTS